MEVMFWIWIALSIPYLLFILGVIVFRISRSIFSSLQGLFISKSGLAEIEITTPNAVVWLIHGTFAKHAAWTKSGSRIRATIENSISGNVQFKAFLWSGRNTITARRKASDSFEEQLTQSINANIGIPHFIVAHSHGGNIAMRTLSNRPELASLTYLACLSTPFLVANRRPRTILFDIAAWIFPIIAIFFGIHIIEDAGWVSGNDILVFPIFFGGLLFCLALGMLSTSLSDKILYDCEYDQLDENQAIFIRTTLDEASLLLNATTFLNQTIHRLFDILLIALEASHNRVGEIKVWLTNWPA